MTEQISKKYLKKFQISFLVRAFMHLIWLNSSLIKALFCNLDLVLISVNY